MKCEHAAMNPKRGIEPPIDRDKHGCDQSSEVMGRLYARRGWPVALGLLLLTIFAFDGLADIPWPCPLDYKCYSYTDSGGVPTSTGFCIAPEDVTPPCVDDGSGCPDCGPWGPSSPPGPGGGGCGFVACQRGPGGAPTSSEFSVGDGMPVWWVSEPYINLWLKDKPLFYQTSRGKDISFVLNYKTFAGDNGAIDTAQRAIFGVGTNWHTPWRSYIQAAGSANYFVFLGDGSARQMALNTGFLPNIDYYSRGILYLDDSGRLCLGLPSGTIFLYNDPVVMNGTTNIFLSQIQDPQGNVTQFSYTATNSNVRLSQITDPDGLHTTFSYTNTAYYTNLISRVTSPYGFVAALAYNTNGQLTSITDVVSLASSFQYDSSNRLSKLITPYGTNSFDYFWSSNSTNWHALRVTELGVRQTLYLEGATNANILPSAASENTALASFITGSSMSQTFESANYTERNTVLWGARQYANLSTTIRSNLDNGTFDASTLSTNDFQKGRLRHWLRNRGNYVPGLALSLERAPSPMTDGTTEGLLTWYDYTDKADNSEEGKMMLPRYEAKRNPGGLWRIVYTERNSIGKPTTQKDTYSDSSGTVQWRTATFTYGANDIDMTSMMFGSDAVVNTFDGAHDVLTSSNALCETTSYAYNSNNQLTNRTSPSGLSTDYNRDGNGWLTSVVDHDNAGVYYRTNAFTYTNGLAYTTTDPRGLTVTNVYDALNRLLKTVYPDGTSASNAYAKLDLAVSYDRLGFTNGFAYDGFRQVIRQTNANGKITTYQYCDCGSLNSATDPLGNVTSFSYDNLGRRTRLTYPDTSYIDYVFDSLGRLSSLKDSALVGTTNFYTINGLVYTASNSAGRVFYRQFDISDHLYWQIDQNGSKAEFSYDAVGRLTAKSNFVASATWPPDGVFDVFSAEGFHYTNGVSGAIAHEEPGGWDTLTSATATSPATTFAYDALGPKTNEVRFDYYGGTPILTNSFNFSAAGDLLTLTDGKTHTTTWKYDQYGHVTNKLDATSAEMFRYRYDADGRLTNRWTPGKTNTGYSYDAAANLTKVTYAVSPSITMSYDANNRLINMIDAVGTTVYSWSSFGAVASEDGPWANDTVTLTYDNGRRRSALNLQAPNASDWVQSYGYDGANRLTNLTSQAGSFNYHYFPGADSIPSPSALVQQINLPNGAYITNLTDNWGRLVSTVLMNSTNAVLNSHSYTLNELNQRTAQTRTYGSAESYTYDALGQLIADSGQEQLNYGYDLAGNLTNRVRNSFTNNFLVNNLNQLSNSTRGGTLTVEGTTTVPASSATVNTLTATRSGDLFWRTGFALADGTNTFTAVASDSSGRGDTNGVSAYLPATVNFSYDLNGNLLSDGLRAFDYDDENQLIRVTVTNVFKSEFSYDGKMRRRVRKEYTWQSSVWRLRNEVRYVYDGNLVIQERDANNLPSLAYTRGKDLSGGLQGAGGIGGLLAFSQLSTLSPQHSFYHADGNGNVTVLINSLQLGVAKYLYDPFGSTLSSSGPLAEANLYRFSSKETHLASSLVYYLYRYYDAGLQRWLNHDPIDIDGGINLYAFSGEDPIGSFDADGLKVDCNKVCAEAALDPNVNLSSHLGGAVICDKDGNKCPCVLPFGVPGTPIIYHPGDCPALDDIIKNHEKKHLDETYCPDKHLCEARFKPKRDPDKSECPKRKADLKKLQDAINKATGTCKEVMQAVLNEQKDWVSKHCK